MTGTCHWQGQGAYFPREAQGPSWLASNGVPKLKQSKNAFFGWTSENFLKMVKMAKHFFYFHLKFLAKKTNPAGCGLFCPRSGASQVQPSASRTPPDPHPLGVHSQGWGDSISGFVMDVAEFLSCRTSLVSKKKKRVLFSFQEKGKLIALKRNSTFACPFGNQKNINHNVMSTPA